MDVVFGIVRKVEIHHQFEIVHINSSAGHIRGHEEIKTSGFEFIHHPGALGLGYPPMEPV